MSEANRPMHALAQILRRDPSEVARIHLAAAGSGSARDLAKLVMSSQAIADRRVQPWEFKSLAHFAEESFVLGSISSWWGDDDWEDRAAVEFERQVVWPFIWRDEGLLLFVQDDQGIFRCANAADPDYEFALRVLDEGLLSIEGAGLAKAPAWSEGLFLYRPNWAAHRKYWLFGKDTHNDPLFERFERMRCDAVLLETKQQAAEGLNLPGPLEPAQAPAPAGLWPWGDRETPLLAQLAAAAQKWWANYDPSDPTTAPTNEQVEGWLSERGLSSRIASAMATMLRADGLPTGPRK